MLIIVRLKKRNDKRKKYIYDKRNAFSLQQQWYFCISNFKTKRVKTFRTMETDGELSKRVKVSCIMSVDGIKLWLFP